MGEKRLLVMLAGLALATALAGCGRAATGQATPSATPLGSAAPAAPTLRAAAPAAVATATLPQRQPESAASRATATPRAEVAVRSGRAVRDVAVRDRPDGQVVGALQAGALAIVVDSQDGQLKIVFGAAPGGYAWAPQDAISAAAEPSSGGGEPAPAAAPEATPQATAQPAAQPAPAATLAPPAPSRPALAGKLVFQTGNGGDIYVVNADGGGLRRLTYGFEPALSPDGRQVAFTRWDEPRGLWVMDVDGANQRLLLGANRPRSPTWTGDGEAIVFERSVRDQQCRQTPIGCLTDDELRALFGGQSCLTTPFGVFCIEDFEMTSVYETALTRYELASGAVRDLPASATASAPRARPHNSQALYLDRGSLALAQIDGDDPPQQLVAAPPLLAPAIYSPDGQFIYAARSASGHWDLWRWRADGSAPTALTTSDPLASRPVNNVAPAVSPDGRSLAFLTDRNGSWQLWVMDSDGGNPRPLAPEDLAGVGLRYDFNSDRAVDWGP